MNNAIAPQGLRLVLWARLRILARDLVVVVISTTVPEQTFQVFETWKVLFGCYFLQSLAFKPLIASSTVTSPCGKPSLMYVLEASS